MAGHLRDSPPQHIPHEFYPTRRYEVPHNTPSPLDYSFDVWKHTPTSPSLQHLAHSRVYNPEGGRDGAAPSFRFDHPPPSVTFPPLPRYDYDLRGEAQPRAPTRYEDEDAVNVNGDTSKRHVCPTCLKRFNRPSSLRIHVNTHTGATRKYSLVIQSGNLFS